MDTGTKLRREFATSQRRAMRQASAQRWRRWFVGILAGAAAGLLAIALTAVVTHIDFFWHSFVLEIGLSAVAGLFLTMTGGGLLKGVFALPAAYAGAFLLRRAGYDPAIFLGGEGSSIVVNGYGHLLAVCTLVGCGGVVGHILESRSK